MTLKSDAKFKEKLALCSKNDMTNLTRAVENLELCTLMGYFCQKYLMFVLKRYR